MPDTPERKAYNAFNEKFRRQHFNNLGEVKYPEGDFNKYYREDDKIRRQLKEAAEKSEKIKRAEAIEAKNTRIVQSEPQEVKRSSSKGPGSYGILPLLILLPVLLFVAFQMLFAIMVTALIWFLFIYKRILPFYLYSKLERNFVIISFIVWAWFVNIDAMYLGQKHDGISWILFIIAISSIIGKYIYSNIRKTINKSKK